MEVILWHRRSRTCACTFLHIRRYRTATGAMNAPQSLHLGASSSTALDYYAPVGPELAISFHVGYVRGISIASESPPPQDSDSELSSLRGAQPSPIRAWAWAYTPPRESLGARTPRRPGPCVTVSTAQHTQVSTIQVSDPEYSRKKGAGPSGDLVSHWG